MKLYHFELGTNLFLTRAMRRGKYMYFLVDLKWLPQAYVLRFLYKIITKYRTDFDNSFQLGFNG